MKKQFLHEAHNLQDKAKNPNYRERFHEEGDSFDRGGASQKGAIGSVEFRFRSSSLCLDLRPVLRDEKQSLLQILERNMKFNVGGNIGTISRLMKNAKLAPNIKERHEMTRRSVLRADTFYWAQHPKKNRQIRVLEFSCFLQPAEPFSNPIPRDVFAFFLKVVNPPD